MRAVKRDMRRLHVTLRGGMPEIMSRLPIGDVLKAPVVINLTRVIKLVYLSGTDVLRWYKSKSDSKPKGK